MRTFGSFIGRRTRTAFVVGCMMTSLAAVVAGGSSAGAAPATATPTGNSATATTLSSSSNPSTLGQQITLTATVIATAGCGTPVGQVTFNDGGTVLGSAFLDPNGTAFLNVSTLKNADAPHNLSAAYGGD